MNIERIRDVIRTKLSEKSLTMKEASLAIGRSHAYIEQFLKGKTQSILEQPREKLEDLLGLERDTLKPMPEKSTNPQVAANVSEKSHTKSAISDYSNVSVTRSAAPLFGGEPRDLPVRGVAIGGDHGRGDFRFNGEVVDYMRRPARLALAKDAFVIYLTGASMEPRYHAGEAVYVHPGQPPRIGDDVLVELYPEREGEAGAAMVKVLLARGPTKVKLKQYNPLNERIEIEARKIKSIYRIIPYSELIGS